jgi:hypothetical protein
VFGCAQVLLWMLWRREKSTPWPGNGVHFHHHLAHSFVAILFGLSFPANYTHQSYHSALYGLNVLGCVAGILILFNYLWFL